MRGSLICQHREAGHWGGGTGRFIMAAKSDRKISRVNQNADPRDERERRPKKALRRPGAEKPDFRYGAQARKSRTFVTDPKSLFLAAVWSTLNLWV